MLHAEVLLWLFSCLCVTGSVETTRIMNGEETTIEEFPYVAVFQKWNQCVCGATILRDNWALTARHCIRGDETMYEMTLRVGSSYRESGGVVIRVDDFKVHDERPGNDIAVLHTEAPFPFGDTVKEVYLASPGFVPKVGKEVTVLGWGRTGPGQELTAVLNKLEMVVTRRKKCKRAAPFPIDKSIVCARRKEGSDACRGDSGGPLMMGDVQVGILSRASCSGRPGAHVLFTSVGYFRNWIEDMIK